MYLEHLCLLKQNTLVATKPLQCQALLNGKPSSDHLWMMYSSAFSFTHSFTQMHIHVHIPLCLCREENCFHHSYFYSLQTTTEKLSEQFPSRYSLGLQWRTLSSVLKDMSLCWRISKQNCQWFSPDFPITTHTPPPIPCSILSAALFQSKSLWFPLKPTLESLRREEMELCLSWNGHVFSDGKP